MLVSLSELHYVIEGWYVAARERSAKTFDRGFEVRLAEPVGKSLMGAYFAVTAEIKAEINLAEMLNPAEMSAGADVVDSLSEFLALLVAAFFLEPALA